MSQYSDVGIESSEQILLQPEVGESATTAEAEDDRSLGAVLGEIARSLAGWLFFVVAIQLLLYGSRLI